MTVKELIRKYCRPVLESKLLEKMEEKVLNYSIEKKPAAKQAVCEADQNK